MSKDDTTTTSVNNDDTSNMTSTSTATTKSSETKKGVAGRIDYDKWDKVASDLVEETEKQEKEEEAAEKAKLGLDGKYARSQAEADERTKAEDVQKVKKTLDAYQEREQKVVMNLLGVLGPVVDTNTDNNNQEESKSSDKTTRRITRNDMDAGTRVLSLRDTSGKSIHDTIVLTQDLSHLESKMAPNAMAKTYQDDAENDVPAQQKQQTSVFGLIKVFLQNLHNCTILIKCKIISGTVELHNCENVVVQVQGPEATVATIQADLSKDITIEFHDAPSGKNTPLPHQKEPTMYWGQDKDDRIFHAGVTNMKVAIYRDGMVETECVADYLKDGAKTVGNATAEEMQFVTSCFDNELLTESVIRTGSSTGRQVRAMTEREMLAEQKMRDKAAKMAVAKADEMIQIKDKHGNPVVAKTSTQQPSSSTSNDNDDAIEEVLTDDVKATVDECEQNKARGNEAFGAGEYGQAILLYSLALDKAEELPSAGQTSSSSSMLFPSDIVLSNRAACFLKLGQHEKAEADAAQALKLNPQNIKALFRQGLALHAMEQYEQALPILAKAYKLEPKNKQVKQALQFCEMRLEQEYRKRMAG